MFSKRVRLTLRIAVLCCCGSVTALAQTQLPIMQEIKLPVRPHPGTLGGGFWAVGFSAGEVFQFRVARDQSLLIFSPNTSGRWPLIRVQKWWTAAPVTEEIDLPGWTESNTRYETDIGTDPRGSPKSGHLWSPETRPL